MDEEQRSEEKSEIASKRQRDAHGRFLPSPDAKNPKPRSNPLTEFLKDETSIHKSQHDELIDIHVGNPLRKITELLEDIKRQKAFSFTLKGSLGVAGIAVVIGTFGIFGGTKAFCSKGIQTKIGIVRTLSHEDITTSGLTKYIPFHKSLTQNKMTQRTILITENGVFHLIARKNMDVEKMSSQFPYIVTGSLDSCTNSLQVQDSESIEAL